MNLLSAIVPRSGNTFQATGKGSSLPKLLGVIIPEGLDDLIRQRLNANIRIQMMGEPGSELSIDSLLKLEKALGYFGKQEAYAVAMYGIEIGLLYSFLLKEEQYFNSWVEGVVPVDERRRVRASLKGFLATLHNYCRRVDVFAFRPTGRKD